MNFTLLYVHAKKGTKLKPGSLVDEHGHRADYLVLPNGDSVGVFRARTAQARKILEAEPGITVLPPLHRPIKDHHATAFAHVNAVAGEDGHSIAERLHEEHGLPWLHPESYDI